MLSSFTINLALDILPMPGRAGDSSDHSLGFLLRRGVPGLVFTAPGLTASPQAATASPAANTLFAALISR